MEKKKKKTSEMIHYISQRVCIASLLLAFTQNTNCSPNSELPPHQAVFFFFKKKVLPAPVLVCPGTYLSKIVQKMTTWGLGVWEYFDMF